MYDWWTHKSGTHATYPLCPHMKARITQTPKKWYCQGKPFKKSSWKVNMKSGNKLDFRVQLFPQISALLSVFLLYRVGITILPKRSKSLN